MNLFDDFPEPICRRNVPLAPLTWFKLGGPAEYLVEPQTLEQLCAVARRCAENGIPLKLLGLGANVLVPDEGVPGVVIRLVAPAFTRIIFDRDRVICGGGVDLSKLVRTLVRKGLAGLEQLAGIPGTVGGGICMNCGGRYGDISGAVSGVRVVCPGGDLKRRTPTDLNFGYRHCALGEDLVVGVAFQLKQESEQAVYERFRGIWRYKQESQPPMGEPSVGCIFRNPAGHSAGRLIDRAGLKGFRIGSAYISERHANFAMAERGGRASDVKSLIVAVAERVLDRFGVRLEPEVKIW